MVTLDQLRAENSKLWGAVSFPGERWQWTFLLGVNYKIRPWKSQRFHYTDSEEGNAILQKIANLKADFESSKNNSLSNFGVA